MVNSAGAAIFSFGLFAIAGETEAVAQKFGTQWSNVDSTKRAVNVWTNIRIEYYADQDKAKVWFGDYGMIASAVVGVTGEDDSNIAHWRFSTASNSDVDMYVDNVICETIVKTYNASDTSR
ncbi:MAG: hypothetical protein J6K44_04450 [Clostridia bacterium]|nr:hypothetical protein [Clostridia bacterium]